MKSRTKTFIALGVVAVGAYLLWKKFGSSVSAAGRVLPKNFDSEYRPTQRYVLPADQQWAQTHAINPYTGEEMYTG